MTIENAPVGTQRRKNLRRLSWVVLAVFIVIAVALFFLVSRQADNQERRLLNERTAEVGLLLSGSLSASLQSSLTSLASAAQESADDFRKSAAAVTGTGASTTTVALVAHQGSNWVVQAAAGKALTTGQTLTGSRLTLVAATEDKIRSDILVVAPRQTRLAVTLGPPAAPAGTVIYEEYALDPSKPATITQSQPFHELNAAIYIGTNADPSKLVLSTTSKLPLHGRTATSEVAVGGGTWLVVAKARQSLSGTLANAMPAILLAAVLLIGIAMTVVVEIVGRRRDYALSLVAERTAALQHSLNQLEAAQQALVTNERLAALGQMAATVGHELRNPLGVLTNSLFLIRTATSAAADDRLRRQLDTADREIASATLIVSDLLEFSRPRASNPVAIDIADLLGEAISVAPPPTGIDVEHDREAVPTVVADRDQIRQVILNLLTNAYEAMPDGGRVHISARTVDDTVEIVVSDNGMGMDEQTQSQIFEPFFSKKIKGTGLGLAVSKRIADVHGGGLNVSSQEGQGCTAILTLPLAHPDAAAIGVTS